MTRRREEQFVFGFSDLAEGGGANPWLTVDRDSGAVLALDLERDQALWTYNSSLERFVATFRLLDPFLKQPQALPPHIEALARDLDPGTFQDSEWRALLTYLRGD